MTYEAKTKLIEEEFREFSNRLAKRLKTSTEDVDNLIKNILNHDAWQRDNWSSDRLSDIGR